jgi:hypothetical protein
MDSGHQRTIAPAEPPTGLIGRAAAHVHQLLCGLHGHDALLHFEHGRISLMCTSCGYETPGWDVKRKSMPAHTYAAQPTPRVVRLPLFGERRVA